MKRNKTKREINQAEGKVYCGIDFHKHHSVLCALSATGEEVLPVTKIASDKLALYLSNRKDWKIGIESSGGVNHVVETLKAQGHEVVIINSNKFRGIGIGGKKTDERDARALADALRLNFVPEVFHRSRSCRELKSLLTTREHIVQARVDSINHIRGTLREYGLTINQGVESFYAEARGKIEELSTTELIKQSLLSLLENIGSYLMQEKSVDEAIALLCKENEDYKRLKTIPGVGPTSAAMMLAVVDDISRFKNSKLFAAYLGLVPSIHASANKRMMGAITRSGCEMLRRYLIHGARAWMRYSPEKNKDSNRVWAEEVKGRRGMNKATVALAHRIARISFAVLKNKTPYTKTIKKDFSAPLKEVA